MVSNWHDDAPVAPPAALLLGRVQPASPLFFKLQGLMAPPRLVPEAVGRNEWQAQQAVHALSAPAAAAVAATAAAAAAGALMRAGPPFYKGLWAISTALRQAMLLTVGHRYRQRMLRRLQPRPTLVGPLFPLICSLGSEA